MGQTSIQPYTYIRLDKINLASHSRATIFNTQDCFFFLIFSLVQANSSYSIRDESGKWSIKITLILDLFVKFNGFDEDKDDDDNDDDDNDDDVMMMMRMMMMRMMIVTMM